MTPRLFATVGGVCVLCLAGLAAVFVAERSNDSHQASSAAAVKRGAISVGDPIPAPRGKAVLRVTGVESGNAGAHATSVDLRTLDQMPRVNVRVYEPFLKREMSFSGVRMSDLLAVIGVSPSAGSIYMHALDDYHVTFTRGQLASSGAVLATRANGARIAIKEGGPIRVIHSRSGRVAENGDNWIWSVDRMRASAPR
jgi:hypothetical protein